MTEQFYAPITAREIDYLKGPKRRKREAAFQAFCDYMHSLITIRCGILAVGLIALSAVHA